MDMKNILPFNPEDKHSGPPLLDSPRGNAEIGGVSDTHQRSAERRTFWGILGDMSFFGIGQSFAGQTTVIPSFLSTLTGSAPLIGLASAISSGGWLIPQLFAANKLASLTHRKAAVAIPATVGRFVSLLMGPAMLLLAPRNAGAALAVFFLLYTVFWVVDGIASVAWLDILGGSLPSSTRARLIGLGNVAPGIAGIGAGVIVGIVLSSSSFPWPYNYGLLFIFCGILYTLSLVSFLFIQEKPSPATKAPLPWPAYFRKMTEVVRGDAPFRRAVAVQLALGGVGIATPFYIVHGLDAMGFPQASVGLFTSMQLAGSVLSALLMGMLGEKRGTRAVMRLWSWLAIVAPGLAVGARVLAPALPGAALYVYAAVFLIVGMQGLANMAGFLNWVLEYAPASDRPLYIGFANTLGGLSLVMPLLGGWLLAATGSYHALFAVAAVGPACALVLLRRLPEPRHAARPV
jgi:MFS family permease